MTKRKGLSSGFTLVELLVVIGIIAVLVGILLPVLGRARESARTLACASNARQLAMAMRLFSQEHRGYMPAVSDEEVCRYRDPTRSVWVWRKSATDPQPVMLDWASSLLPYLGVRNVEWFPYAPDNVSKVFKCPSDRWQDLAGKYGEFTLSPPGPVGPGFMIYNNVDPYLGGYPISYGTNADIGSVVYSDNKGHFAMGEIINVYGGPPGTGGVGLPMGAKLDKVKKSAEVLLIGDCGTRPNTLASSGLVRQDVLIYTSHLHAAAIATLGAENAGKLSGVQKHAQQSRRIPWERHRNKINVAFVDGHGETIQKGDENKVRISPWLP